MIVSSLVKPLESRNCDRILDAAKKHDLMLKLIPFSVSQFSRYEIESRNRKPDADFANQVPNNLAHFPSKNRIIESSSSDGERCCAVKCGFDYDRRRTTENLQLTSFEVMYISAALVSLSFYVLDYTLSCIFMSLYYTMMFWYYIYILYSMRYLIACVLFSVFISVYYFCYYRYYKTYCDFLYVKYFSVIVSSVGISSE